MYMSVTELPEEITNTISIENIVGMSDLGMEVDLKELSIDLQRATFNETEFPGLIHTFEDNETTILLFRSGKVVYTGASSIESIETAVETLEKEFDSIGLEHDELTISIKNMVSTAELSEEINLNAAAIALGLEEVEYEPEQFPGLVYRMDDFDMVLIIFTSGQVVLTSGVTKQQIHDALTELYVRFNQMGLL